MFLEAFARNNAREDSDLDVALLLDKVTDKLTLW